MVGNTRTRSDIKREAIIQAATQAFQEFGVNGTSMDKLAELANVSKRTVYNHFSTKEELVMHLVTQQWQTAMHRWLKDAKADNKLAFDDLERVVDEIDSLVKGQCFWPQLFKIEDTLSDSDKKSLAKNTAALILSRYAIA